MRDAQQSLMATRVRTVDMEKIAPAVSVYGKDLFSVEMGRGYFRYVVPFPQRIAVGKTGYSQEKMPISCSRCS